MSEPDAMVRASFVGGAIPPCLRPILAGLSGPPTLDRYPVAGLLGEGGMATVYRATDRELGRPVALKVLKDSLQSDPQARERFLREGRTAGSLSHPNLVAIHDVGESGGRLYLVMELVDGEPLGDLLRRGALDRRAALELLEKSSRAVHHAHARGIIHRDIKPGNILVTSSGEPKVGDFGLAHVAGAGQALTRTGSSMGTPSYMAPEQIQGRPSEISARTDIYGLGATLYEILTGRPPHTGGSVLEVYAKIVGEDPAPPRRVSTSVPADLETVCLKALEKDPRRRYASAEAFADDLRRHLAGEPVLAMPPSLASRGRRWIFRHRAAAGMTSIAAAGLAAVILVLLASAAGRRAEARRIVDGLLADGHKAAASLSAADDGVRRLEERVRHLGDTIDPEAEMDLKRPLWAAEIALDAARADRSRQRAELVGAFTKALGVDPDCGEALRGLADHYWKQLVKAEEEGREEGVAEIRALLLAYDREGRYRRRLDAGGTVRIVSTPSGAAVYVFRYEPGDGRRLMPRPVSPRTGLSRIPALESTPETAYALECGDYNLAGPAAELALPKGSYLFLLRKEGYPDVRYPALVQRELRIDAKVPLYTAEEIGPDFVYLPAGPFIAGGDPEAYNGLPRDPAAFAGPVFIARAEVTIGEYAEFLDDLIRREGVAAAQKRVPRASPSAPMWKIPPDGRHRSLPTPINPRSPAVGLSWSDCDAYCRWLSDRSGLEIRMPTNLEWEKAARGADGRCFPWGNHFDLSFTNGSSDPPPARRVGGAYPADESPFGILDLGGSVREWCQDWSDAREKWKHSRGGGVAGLQDVVFRSAGRFWNFPDTVTQVHGFRLAREPRRSH